MSLLTTPMEYFILQYAFIAWFLSEVLGAWVRPRFRSFSSKTIRDRGSGALIIIAVFVSIAVAFSFSNAGFTPLPDWVFYLGISMMVLGIGVRQWAIAVLGRFFSLDVRVQADHRVVDKGPYGLVRHPAYTGAILTLLGMSFALKTWGATIVLLVIFGIAFGYRIHVEEKTLSAELGSDYTSYMKRTKRLLPYLL